MNDKITAPAVKRDEFDGASTVTVYCRLPNGFHMRAQERVEYMEQTPNGAQKAYRFVPIGDSVRIEGNAKGRGADADKTEHKRIVAGFAVTEGVPADLWKTWTEQNKGLDFLARGDVFAVVKRSDTDAKRNDASKAPTGLDPLNPADMPTEFRRVSRA